MTGLNLIFNTLNVLHHVFSRHKWNDTKKGHLQEILECLTSPKQISVPEIIIVHLLISSYMILINQRLTSNKLFYRFFFA